MRLGNLLKLVLRLELCLLQAKGLCSGSDIIFPSTLLRLGLGNKSEARPSVVMHRFILFLLLIQSVCLTDEFNLFSHKYVND